MRRREMRGKGKKKKREAEERRRKKEEAEKREIRQRGGVSIKSRGFLSPQIVNMKFLWRSRRTHRSVRMSRRGLSISGTRELPRLRNREREREKKKRNEKLQRIAGCYGDRRRTERLSKIAKIRNACRAFLLERKKNSLQQRVTKKHIIAINVIREVPI